MFSSCNLLYHNYFQWAIQQGSRFYFCLFVFVKSQTVEQTSEVHILHMKMNLVTRFSQHLSVLSYLLQGMAGIPHLLWQTLQLRDWAALSQRLCLYNPYNPAIWATWTASFFTFCTLAISGSPLSRLPCPLPLLTWLRVMPILLDITSSGYTLPVSSNELSSPPYLGAVMSFPFYFFHYVVTEF